MKEKNRTPAGVFFIAGIFLFFISFFISCDTPWGEYWEYTFENQTQYSITVSLNKSYRSQKEGSDTSGPFQVGSNSSKKVYVKAGSVDFEWDSYASNYNRYIYPVTGGSRVTFKERAR
jgi:hypothetical protein